MDIAIWILMCLMACYGAVEAFGRLFYGGRPPRCIPRGCLLIPLPRPETARRELEYYLSYVQWNGMSRPIVFVSAEAEEGVREVFQEVMGGIPEACLCTPDQVCVFVKSLLKEDSR